MEGPGREQEKPSHCISGPVPGTSSCLGHKRDPQLPAVALTKRTFVKRVSFNFACKKIILHIFCTSLTVPIEPGPCRFAEGSGHDFPRTQPDPKREEEAGRGGGSWGAPKEGGRGSAAASRQGPSAQATHLQVPAPQHASLQRALPAGKGQPALDKARWCCASVERSFVLWFDIFLDSMLQFSLFWFSISFKFCFPRGRGGRRVFTKFCSHPPYCCHLCKCKSGLV